MPAPDKFNAPTLYCKTLMGAGNYFFPYKLVSYGARLVDGKARVNAASAALKIAEERRALFIVMAMIETTYLEFWQYDWKKDASTDGSRNYSIFNLNEYMLKTLGVNGSYDVLNSHSGIQIAIHYLDIAIDQWGVRRLLDFVRGGATAFITGKGDHLAEYHNGVAQGLELIDKDRSLLESDIRIEMNITEI